MLVHGESMSTQPRWSDPGKEEDTKSHKLIVVAGLHQSAISRNKHDSEYSVRDMKSYMK